MRKNYQKGYMRIADIKPIWDDISIADISQLSEIYYEGKILIS